MNLNNKKIKLILWVVLIIMCIGMFNGVIIRLKNEKNNINILPVADYYTFYDNASIANRDMEDTLSRLKEAGVHTIAINELTIQKLADYGLARVGSCGQIISSMLPISGEDAQAYKRLLEQNPLSTTIIPTSDKEKQRLFKELGMRYNDDELLVVESKGFTAFVINTEIYETKYVGTGFDEEVLDSLQKAGFDIILRSINSNGSNLEYLNYLKQLFNKYNVSVTISAGKEMLGYPDNMEEMQDYFKDNNVVIGVIESPIQIGLVDFKGQEAFIKETNYSINRVFSMYDFHLEKADQEIMFYQWLRAIVDRNNRIIYVKPGNNPKLKPSEDMDNAINAIGTLNEYIVDKGYIIDGTLNQPMTIRSGILQSIFAMLSLLIASLLFLMYLIDAINIKYIFGVFVIGIALCIPVITVLKMDLTKIYALGAAVLYPTLGSLLVLKNIKLNYAKNFFVQLGINAGIVIGMCTLAAITIGGSMSDVRYIMNIELFRGVKLAFLLPIVMLFVNYIIVFEGLKGLSIKAVQFLKASIPYSIAFGVGALGVAAYVYIARSGNTAIYISPIELAFREALEKLLLARPRIKEFLIGWPSLVLLIAFYHKYKHKVIILIGGLGLMVGSISMTNSFCHVFTALKISTIRTLYGAVLGLALGLVLAFIINVISDIIEKNIYKNAV